MRPSSTVRRTLARGPQLSLPARRRPTGRAEGGDRIRPGDGLLLTRPDYPTESEKLDLVGNAVLDLVSLAAIALMRSKRLAATTRLRMDRAVWKAILQGAS